MELAFVAIILVTLVFGIINFGLLLNFKQDVTRAAAEGARGGAVALPSATSGANDPRRLAAVTATNQAVTGFDGVCGSGGLVCVTQIHDCALAIPDSNTSASPDTNGYKDNGEPDCVTVRLVYTLANDPDPGFVPKPIIKAVLPATVAAKSVARLND